MASIDMLLIERSASEARRLKAVVADIDANASIVRVLDVDQALRLMFEYRLFTTESQIPHVIVCAVQDRELEPLFTRLKKENLSGIPVIALLESEEPALRARSHKLGARMHIIKTAPPDTYRRQIEMALRSVDGGT